MLWNNALLLSLPVKWKVMNALEVVEQGCGHKHRKIVFSTLGKGFLPVSCCSPWFESCVCLPNGMGVSHPALADSSGPAVIQSERCSFSCPRGKAFTLDWRRIMLALLLLAPCLHFPPAATEPSDPFAGSSAACSTFYWIELQIWGGRGGSEPSISIPCPCCPSHGTRADPEEMQPAFVERVLWWD